MKKWFICLALFPALSRTQVELPLTVQTPPRGTSHVEMMEYLRRVVPETKKLEVEIRGQSHEGRDIQVVFWPNRTQWESENPTVMIFAQQHGNEPSGKEALLMLIHELHLTPDSARYPHLNLILVPMVNPDGNEAHRRRNANDADLNRNHVILTEPETRLLHSLFEQYKPEVTLDVHEYGSGTWLKYGYIKDFGEQLDCLSNLAIPGELKQFALTQILEPTLEKTRSRGVKANRYLITRPELDSFVRHSTTDINDGRNGFGIRFTLSFILEGLNGMSKEDRIWERGKHQLTLIESFLELCESTATDIVSLVRTLRSRWSTQLPDSVIIQADYTEESSRPLDVVLRRTSDLKDTTITLSDYRPEPQAIVRVKRPDAYIIERPTEVILQLIKNHRIEYRILASRETYTVEQFEITGRDTLRYESRDTVIPEGLFTRTVKSFSPGDLLVPADNARAAQIVQMMEPQSLYGISHYEQFEYLNTGSVFLIYRVYLRHE